MVLEITKSWDEVAKSLLNPLEFHVSSSRAAKHWLDAVSADDTTTRSILLEELSINLTTD